jgi:hypothetical protein
MDNKRSGPPQGDAERIAKLEALARRPGTPGEGQAARAAIGRIVGARLPDGPLRIGERIVGGCIIAPACRYCGAIIFTVTAGTGPHAAALRCARCGCFARWLRRSLIESTAA